MSCFRGLAVAAALICAIGCGKQAADSSDGAGGADGFGDNKQPTPAERAAAPESAGAMSALTEQDRQFVEKASMSGRMEVALGNLAEDKAQDDRVKQFGEQLARDHEAANRDLQSSLGGSDATRAQQPRGTSARDEAARTGGAGAPAAGGAASAEMHEQMQQAQQTLSRVSGAAFDRAYLEEMVKHHQQDIREFERAAQSDEAQIRAFAERTLPVLRQHLQDAQRLLGDQQR